VRNRVGQRQAVEQFSCRTNYYPARKKCKVFLQKNKLCARRENRLQSAPMSRPRLVGLLLALITLGVYFTVGRNNYLDFDDDDYVTNNQIVQNGLTWAGIKWAFTTWHASNWHPLTWLSLMTDCEIFGPNAGAQHYVNVLIHAANAVLLLLLLFRLTGALWPSAFASALFAWHPLHVESVAWIAERKDVLSVFFEMLALLAYVRYAQKRAMTGDRARGQAVQSRTYGYFLALSFFMLGLLAKPMLVTLPFMMLLLDYWPLQRFKIQGSGFRVQNLVLEKIPFFLLAAGSCLVTFLAQSNGGVVKSLQQFPLPERLGNAVLSYALYLEKTVWPASLAIVYPFQNPLPWKMVSLAAIFLVIVTGLAWRVRRSNPQLLMGWLWFLGTLVPVIGIVQVGNQALADRYTYIPLVGIFIAVAFSIPGLIERLPFPKIFIAAAVSILVGCVILTENQLRYWRNSESLYRHAIAVTKDNHMAYYCLGLALTEQHKAGEALAEYREAERLAPGIYETHRNIGNLLDDMGKPAEALAEYREAVRLRPDISILHENLATLLVELGQVDEAMSQYAEAARLDPTDPRPRYLMGRTLLRLGRDAEAVDEFRQALRADSDDFQTLLFLASTLASDENPQIRNGAEAVTIAKKAATFAGNEQSSVLEVLAMSYAEAGRFADAQQAERSALQLATAAGLKNTNVMDERLELYKSGRPYREQFANPSFQDIPKK
jgi:tetratricopeptide (TPR) repeat protein